MLTANYHYATDGMSYAQRAAFRDYFSLQVDFNMACWDLDDADIALPVRQKPFITHRSVTPERICLMTRNGSIAELDHLPAETLDAPGIWFWFSRLKAKKEGQGEGSFLMHELVKVLDERGVNVLCQLNPYGQLDHAALRTFYAKFGFVDLAAPRDYIMIRHAK